MQYPTIYQITYTLVMQTVPVYHTEQIRQIENHFFALEPKPQLMELAGKTIANITVKVAPEQAQSILVIAGPGNNGGDAYVAARHLKSANFHVSLVEPIKPLQSSSEKEDAVKKWKAIGGVTKSTTKYEKSFDIVIDGLFGIGLNRTLPTEISKYIQSINEQESTVISIDIPSGLNANTGAVMGSCVRADHTVTFLGYKVGLHTGQGPDCSGIIHFSDLNMGNHPPVDNHGYLIGNDVLRNVLVPRDKSSHKGTHGQLAVIGGSKGMIGAALLTGRAGLRLGAGRVFIGLLDSDSRTPAADWGQPELMFRDATELVALEKITCFAIGPGLGTNNSAYKVLGQVIAKPAPIILDADALNIVAQQPTLTEQIEKRINPTIMTPHPGEASRLLGISIAEIQANRIQIALDLASKFNAEVVLKGVGSVCAFQDGNWFVNTSGNPGMASAGMGDALTGIIGAFVSQGAYTHTAMLAGVHLHGLAADQLLHDDCGPIGMTASETIDSSRIVFNRFQNKNITSFI